MWRSTCLLVKSHLLASLQDEGWVGGGGGGGGGKVEIRSNTCFYLNAVITLNI